MTYDDESAFENQSNAKAPSAPIEIPLDQLSPEAVENLIESFILREGTDYGAQEISLSTKMQQISNQLKRGEIKIVYDPDSESVTLMTKRDFERTA